MNELENRSTKPKIAHASDAGRRDELIDRFVEIVRQHIHGAHRDTVRNQDGGSSRREVAAPSITQLTREKTGISLVVEHVLGLPRTPRCVHWRKSCT